MIFLLHLNKSLRLGRCGAENEAQPAPDDVNGQEMSAIEGTGNVLMMNCIRTLTKQQIHHCC